MRRIIESFKIKELIGKKVFDFLPRIDPYRPDQEILERWKKHFKDRSVPFFITEEDIYLSGGTVELVRKRLWKEVLVESEDYRASSVMFNGKV